MLFASYSHGMCGGCGGRVVGLRGRDQTTEHDEEAGSGVQAHRLSDQCVAHGVAVLVLGRVAAPVHQERVYQVQEVDQKRSAPLLLMIVVCAGATTTATATAVAAAATNASPSAATLVQDVLVGGGAYIEQKLLLPVVKVDSFRRFISRFSA